MPKLLPEESSAVLPLLPLRGMLIFPHTVSRLEVGRERSVRALEEAMAADGLILLAAQKDPQVVDPEPDEVYSVGTVAEVKQLLKMPEGQISVLVEGIRRVRLLDFVHAEPCHRVRVAELSAALEQGIEIEALMRTVNRLFDQYAKLGKKPAAEVLAAIAAATDPHRCVDLMGAQLTINVDEKQALLSSESARERLEFLTAVLTREIDILELEKRIQTRVRKQMERTQKEYYLREQIKAIQKELGEKDERQSEVDELRARVEAARLPKEPKEKALHELKRLERMPPLAAEAVVVRTYLDWLLALPWTKKTKDRLDLAAAERILDEDHYGLNKVKERVLEFLAVRHLAEKLKGPILCFVGPPGVGKTSLARSIARALDRKFVRFSLGGVRDEAEIRGHRRTYVGAMPGKVIQAMRQAGTRNPVILLDEVDKMAMDFRGDPSAALLEVLDPEQNSRFGDHYLELTFDLSDVTFITTGNVLPAIPRPLRDRMEVIEIPGYTEEEKFEIARRHVVPKQVKAHGLSEKHLELGEGALKALIAEYTREAGVRTLEREIASVCRKVAREVVGGGPDALRAREEKPLRIGRRQLHKYLGPPRFRPGLAEAEDRVGVATGLVYTVAGGDVISIEVTSVPGKGRLALTGKLGEVMRESAQAGLSYIRARAAVLGIDAAFHEQTDLHIHVPEGAVPKEGPSAGITIATALVSALTGRPVRHDVAMTGEITLRGRVLPIGGLKEKLLAGYRAGIRTVLIPAENRQDLEDLPAKVKRRLKIIGVEHMDEVLEIALCAAAALPGAESNETGGAEQPESVPFVPPDPPAPDAWIEDPAP